MLAEDIRRAIVDDLIGAHQTKKPIPLLSKAYPGITLDDAYAIQHAFVQRRVDAGGTVKGYKVGLTSKPMQEMAGSSEPDYSAMTDDLFLAEGGTYPIANFFGPLIEIEIAFVMKEALKGPGVLPVDVVRATDFVLPAIELVDFRYDRKGGGLMNLIDNVADLAYCGAVILGANPRRLDQIDVRRVRGALIRGGKTEVEGESSAVLGNPVTSVAWLANKLGEFGVTFEPGQVILTGSFVRALPVKAGDQIVCRFDQGLGDVAVSFE
ncbi:MAG: 4-oxalocrotonate decarboxylase [Alphaproteobacteria bacterium]|nr:4-oxalocrotonate decarboxylase [Alphaproteobacteria bacterium]